MLVPSSLDLANSLTAYNASSSPRTLTVMLIIAPWLAHAAYPKLTAGAASRSMPAR